MIEPFFFLFFEINAGLMAGGNDVVVGGGDEKGQNDEISIHAQRLSSSFSHRRRQLKCWVWALQKICNFVEKSWKSKRINNGRTQRFTWKTRIGKNHGGGGNFTMTKKDAFTNDELGSFIRVG